jgi:hypothetical protein
MECPCDTAVQGRIGVAENDSDRASTALGMALPRPGLSGKISLDTKARNDTQCCNSRIDGRGSCGALDIKSQLFRWEP